MPEVRRQRAEELEGQLNKGALWAVTYGDLMSYLMIFFLVLFSFSVTKKKGRSAYEQSLANIQKTFGKELTEAQKERLRQLEREDKVQSDLERRIEEQKLSDLVQVVTTEEKIRLILQAPVLFDSGRAVLKSQARAILAPIMENIRAVSNEIIVEGHTDSLPIRRGKYKTNWELSMARAYSVISYLESVGVASYRLSGIGYGEQRPVAPNDTREGRAKNRRIEISLMRK